MKPALVWKGVCKPKSPSLLACEQAPVFGRAKRVARERASLSTSHDIPQMENFSRKLSFLDVISIDISTRRRFMKCSDTKSKQTQNFF